MLTDGKAIVENIRNLVQEGSYIAAYEYAKNHDSNDKEHMKLITCFRSLLACVTNGPVPKYEFSSISPDPGEYSSPLDYEKITNKLDCYNEMFNQLKELCRKQSISKQ